MKRSNYVRIELIATILSIAWMIGCWVFAIRLSGVWPLIVFLVGFVPYILIVNVLLKGCIRSRSVED